MKKVTVLSLVSLTAVKGMLIIIKALKTPFPSHPPSSSARQPSTPLPPRPHRHVPKIPRPLSRQPAPSLPVSGVALTLKEAMMGIKH